MEASSRVLGEEHPDTLTAMANLASTYSNQGRWKEAKELNVKVMEASLRVLGEEHPDTLTAMANLAATYRNQGRWKEAEELELPVLDPEKQPSKQFIKSNDSLSGPYIEQGLQSPVVHNHLSKTPLEFLIQSGQIPYTVSLLGLGLRSLHSKREPSNPTAFDSPIQKPHSYCATASDNLD